MTGLKLKSHFGRFLSAAPERLHFAAHSHHFWPDVSFAAQQQCWDDAARLADAKWEIPPPEPHATLLHEARTILPTGPPFEMLRPPQTQVAT